MLEQADAARATMLEKLAMYSDELMERLLNEQEISEELDLNEKTISSRLSKCRNSLSKYLRNKCLRNKYRRCKKVAWHRRHHLIRRKRC